MLSWSCMYSYHTLHRHIFANKVYPMYTYSTVESIKDKGSNTCPLERAVIDSVDLNTYFIIYSQF